MSSFDSKPTKQNNPSRGGSRKAPHTSALSLSSLPSDRLLSEELAPNPLQAVSLSDLELPSKTVKIADLKVIGSYNWIDSSHPTIIIPGSPAYWQDKPLPITVQPDQGISFVDQNGFRLPASTLLPLMMAVDEQREGDGNLPMAWGSLDFVTDRNNLRKLLRWIGGTASKDFRIDLQLAGSRTVLMSRWEKRHQEQMPGWTYGFNFERASSTFPSGCEDSTGHHRIIQYDLNGLAMVVRFEVDACIPPATLPPSARPAVSTIDDLADALSGVKINRERKPLLSIIKAGTLVPQSNIIEMTTRAQTRVAEFDWKENYPQLYLSQTGHHYLAVHQRGRFVEVQKRTLASPELKVENERQQADFKKLKGALDFIQKIVIKHGQRGSLSLVCEGGKLKLYERLTTVNCLPETYMDKYEFDA